MTSCARLRAFAPAVAALLAAAQAPAQESRVPAPAPTTRQASEAPPAVIPSGPVVDEATPPTRVVPDGATLPPPPVTGTFPFINFEWLDSAFTVLPIQMFNWISRPTQDFHQNAAATGLVLIIMTLTMNGFAIAVRYRMRRKIKW